MKQTGLKLAVAELVANGEGCGVDLNDNRIPASAGSPELSSNEVGAGGWLCRRPREFGPAAYL